MQIWKDGNLKTENQKNRDWEKQKLEKLDIRKMIFAENGNWRNCKYTKWKKRNLQEGKLEG